MFVEDLFEYDLSGVPRGHPLENWVLKQRSTYKVGTIQPWKLALLEEFDFQWMGARTSSLCTDHDYSRILYKFYLENGHFAPTQTYGGAGLTKWVRKMKASGGMQGIKTGSTKTSAIKASKYLKRKIPGFTWEGTSKSAINSEQGLTHNGYSVSARPESETRRAKIARGEIPDPD